MTTFFPPLILASSSPRRKDILNQLHINYICMEPHITEQSEHSDPIDFCIDIATQKAKTIVQTLQQSRIKNHSIQQNSRDIPKIHTYRYILSADTVVYCKNNILQKPKTLHEAMNMLATLANTHHKVYSAICLLDRKTKICAVDCAFTTVYVASITEQEMQTYLSSQEWQGVAGGYRIQGLGACFIKKIEGEYSTVQGLPIRLLYDIISKVLAIN